MTKFRNDQAPRQTRGQTKKQATAVDLAANKKGKNSGRTSFDSGLSKLTLSSFEKTKLLQICFTFEWYEKLSG
jgi:hypothetical protein